MRHGIRIHGVRDDRPGLDSLPAGPAEGRLRVLAGQGAQVDTTTAGGCLMFGIFAALAEFERELIRERTVAGLEAARARGRKVLGA